MILNKMKFTDESIATFPSKLLVLISLFGNHKFEATVKYTLP